MKHKWTFPCKLDDNYDGDTFKLEMDVGFGNRHYAAVRLDGVDTPELRGGSDLTKASAKLARDKAEVFVRSGVAIFHCTVWLGKYGRPIGEIYVDGKRLSEYLISLRLGIPYTGGSRANFQACHEANATYLMESGKLDDYL